MNLTLPAKFRSSAMSVAIAAATVVGTLSGASTASAADGAREPSMLSADKIASLQAQVERAQAYAAVQNLMGRYSYYHTAGKHLECLDLFAMKTADSHVEMVWGVYKGPEGIRRLYPGFHAWSDGNGIGKMFVHTMTTPVIEVAGDGKTAKGVWTSPGSETYPEGNKEGGKISGRWSWIKYGADFIKEEGQWKIWHLHVYGLFSAEPGKGWVDVEFDPDKVQGFGSRLPKEFQPDAPPTTRLWKFQKTVKPELVPVPPTPYEHFDPATAY